ncbi:MAG: (d)CMP kinase [Longimicrobiales bacterium]
MIIAIDGPAGSGKSTTAREVARRLGFRHLDSGAFYRALTLGALRAGIAVERWPTLTAAQLDALDVRALPAEGSFRMTLRGEAVDAEIRAPEINAHVSAMAKVPAVRTWLLDRLRAAAEGVDLVSEGRDVGTVVFPHAELKIFLVAEPATRARRRLRELGITDPSADDLAAESGRLLRRDRIDTERDVAPLRKAADAVEIDTSRLGFDEQVGKIVELVERRRTA